MATSVNYRAKWLEPLSVVSFPELHKYSMDHTVRETPVQKNLRNKIEQHERAVLSSPPDESQLLAVLIQLMKAKNVIGI
jgi:hypothetical protein